MIIARTDKRCGLFVFLQCLSLLLLSLAQSFLQKKLAIWEIAGQSKTAVYGDELAGHIWNLRKGVGGEGDILRLADAANGLRATLRH